MCKDLSGANGLQHEGVQGLSGANVVLHEEVQDLSGANVFTARGNVQDLSGANVLLHEEVEEETQSDSCGDSFDLRTRSFRAKVSDFGLSKNVESILSAQSEGTITHAAPELMAEMGRATKVRSPLGTITHAAPELVVEMGRPTKAGSPLGTPCSREEEVGEKEEVAGWGSPWYLGGSGQPRGPLSKGTVRLVQQRSVVLNFVG